MVYLEQYGQMYLAITEFPEEREVSKYFLLFNMAFMFPM